MKRFLPGFLLIISCFCLACGNYGQGEPDNKQAQDDNNDLTPHKPNDKMPPDNGKQKGNESNTNSGLERVISYDWPRPGSVKYQVELVNNTDSTVTILPPGSFVKCEKDGVNWGATMRTVRDYQTADDMSAFEFSFIAEHRDVFYFYELDTTKEEIEAQTKERTGFPMLKSFFLKIMIDDAEYFLAGWPQSLDLPPVGADVLDTDKIVQYGIGYSDISELRYSENRMLETWLPLDPAAWEMVRVPYEYDQLMDGYWRGDYHGYGEILEWGPSIEQQGPNWNEPPFSDWVREVQLVYAPMIISYEQDGRTEECDFDNAVDCNVVYAKAVLTIDGPDHIEFRTRKMSLTPFSSD